MDEAWLIPITFATSTISGATGLGGGVILLAAMSSWFVPSALIPIHAAVQLTSNLSRTAFSIREIRWDIVLQYGIGAVVGAILGSQIVVTLPEQVLWLSLGTFILALTWLPIKKYLANIPARYPVVGGVSTFLSLFVGITGPLAQPFIIQENLSKGSYIGTEAACASLTHILKIAVYVATGMALWQYWRIMVPMIVASLIGSYMGKLILGKIPHRIFFWLIRLIVTVLSLRMIFRGFR